MLPARLMLGCVMCVALSLTLVTCLHVPWRMCNQCTHEFGSAHSVTQPMASLVSFVGTGIVPVSKDPSVQCCHRCSSKAASP